MSAEVGPELTQAVILAGGLGTRLGELTRDRPKPMIEFHGRPFLEYLVELLKEQGFARILMLLGYKAEQIQGYFGDGARHGVAISYSVSDVADDTGRRVKIAEPLCDPVFMLMYCDNYWPMDRLRMWARFRARHPTLMVTVYRNADRYSRDNLRVGPDGFIEEYDKTRMAPNLQGVDIGFMICRREALELLPARENVSFERTVFSELVRRRALLAYLTEHRYYSVSTPERLAAAEEFLARRPAVLLDRDGVLNRKPEKARYVRSPAEWQWMPGAIEAVATLKAAGFRVLVITNQAGIARGEMTESDLAAIHAAMQRDLAAHGAAVDRIYYCPHGWDDGCECRKPKPGMLFQAQRDFNLDLSRTVFIGDDERDAQAGEAAGCPTVLIGPGRSLLDVVRSLVGKARAGGR